MKKSLFIVLLVIAAIILLAAGYWYFRNPVKQFPSSGGQADGGTDKDTEVPSAEEWYQIKNLKASGKTVSGLGMTADNFPVIDGATSTQPIRSLIACAVFEGRCDYWYETESREMFLSPDLYGSPAIGTDKDSYKKIELLHSKFGRNSKTHDAYVDLIIGRNDLILVSTKPSESELDMAKKLGVKLELVPIGLDGFVFLVNDGNRLTNLKTQDIKDIYSGKVKNWKGLNGVDAAIKAFTRQANSGSQELMEKLVMKEIPMDKNLKQEEVIMTMGGLIDEVGFDENSFGYSLYYYKNNMIDKREIRPSVKLISVDGVEPNPQTISSGKYPYTFNIYAVTRADQSAASPACKLKEWLTGEEGQGIIRKAGYIPLK